MDKLNIMLEDTGMIPVRNIYCTVRNYLSHAKEMGAVETAKYPVFFQKSLSSFSTKTEIELPKNRRIQFELELVILIGKNGENISESNAIDYVDGLALGLDLTDRKLQSELKEKRMPWFLSKSFKNSAIVTDFQSINYINIQLPFWLEKNNKRVQVGYIKDMQFSISQLISYLSSNIPLMAGDIIFTGTPEGVGYLSDGDELTLGLGDKIKGRFTIINRPK